MQSYILLDGSSSMSTRWAEALGGINKYQEGLKEQKGDFNTTVVYFDSNVQWRNPFNEFQGINNNQAVFTAQPVQPVDHFTFDILRNKVSVRAWKPLTNEDCQPRGSTPLYDATMKLLDLVEADGYEKAVIVIVTDGDENSSKITRDPAVIKRRISALQERGYQFLFLGADFNNAKQSYAMGGNDYSTMQVRSANLASTLEATASKAGAYFSHGTAMGYTATEKADALK